MTALEWVAYSATAGMFCVLLAETVRAMVSGRRHRHHDDAVMRRFLDGPNPW